jgi:hypothetical protein
VAREDVHGVTLRVEGFEEVLALALALLVDVGDVALLDVGGVAQHVGAEVAGGGGGVDVAGEVGAEQRGEVAAVVDVGVGEDDGVDVGGVKGEVAVTLEALLALALGEAAVKQELAAADFQQVHGAGDGAGGAEKVNFHPG